MAKDDDGLLGLDDASGIGFQIVEMADRVKAMHAIVPGAVARWKFKMDDIEYDVAVAVSRDG